MILAAITLTTGPPAPTTVLPEEPSNPPEKIVTTQKPAAPTAGKSEVKAEQEWQTFEATAYIAMCDTGCTGITATGVDVRNTTKYKGRTVIAVDPKVIPLGTKLVVKLADGTEIAGIAADTGGAIKGRRIDLLMESREAALRFGRQDVLIAVWVE